MTILQKTTNYICTLTLNNPKIHNAFDDQLIQELTDKLSAIEKDNTIRAVIIRANGKHFSAGANLNWMRSMMTATQEENEQDALKLSNLLATLDNLSKPTIALTHGLAMGGGIGLIACCDIVIAAHDAQFCFSEVKLGLIPATIAPYVIRKIGYNAARYYFITAENFSAHSAQQIGLVHQIVTGNDLNQHADIVIKKLLNNGPQAITATKQLINQVLPVDDTIIKNTANLLASIRVSPEGQEGMKAFFEKRKPKWIETDNYV